MQYKSNDSKYGYNLRLDSETKCFVPKETRELQSKSHKLRLLNNPELKEKMSLQVSNYWKNNQDKIEDMAKLVSFRKRKFKIAKCVKNTFDIITIYDSKFEILKEHPDFYMQAIWSTCQGYKKSYKGFSWFYVDKTTNEIIQKNMK